jgi:hypothetical protein
MKIRHYIILLSLGTVFCATKAQIVITTPYEFAYGVSGGTTFSSVTFMPRVLEGKRIGATFGLVGRMAMGKNVGLQLELNYAQQGWKEKYEDEDGKPIKGYKYNRLINYGQLPFYTRVQFGEKKIKWFFLAGPQIGYMIGESTNENLNGSTPGKENRQHNMPVQKKFEWGISGGLGVEIRTGIGCFTLEGRYLYSLGDIYNSRREDPFSKSSGQILTTKIAYLIPVRRRP